MFININCDWYKVFKSCLVVRDNLPGKCIGNFSLKYYSLRLRSGWHIGCWFRIVTGSRVIKI